MDAIQLFFERYRGFQEYPKRLLDGMTEQQIRQSPHPAVNPIAWTLWHTARYEDIAVNCLLTDQGQVAEDGGWTSRLAVPFKHAGTGMTREEVEALCEQINLPALAAYQSAVTERTVDVVSGLPAAGLLEKLIVENLQQVFVTGGLGGKAADWLVEAYAGQTKGWLLGHLVLTHHYYHIGQAFAARAMHGLASPW